jgi:hypothetical protein
MSKPEWVIRLEAEPCECVSCGDCGGTGTVYYDIGGNYVGEHMHDDMDSPESCDMCSGGTVDECDRCILLNDYDREAEAVHDKP